MAIMLLPICIKMYLLPSDTSMLWTFAANIASFVWCLYNTLVILMVILLLPIYIKMYLLPSDTSTTDKKRYVSVQFHAV